MVDLAIGVIIGVAFGKVISSLVADVIMPPIGLLLGGIDFSSFQWILKGATATEPSVAIRYGTFLNAVIDFLIIAWVIFLVIKGMNVWRKAKPADPTVHPCPHCLSDIPMKAKKCKFCTSTV